jgi:hypothetical protein
LLVALMLYASSFAFPAYYSKFNGAMSGYIVLILGWFAALNFQFAWFANVAVLFGFVLIVDRRTVAAKRAALIICVLAANALTLPGTSIGELSGRTDQVLTLGTGAYLWIASMFVFALAIFTLADARSTKSAAPSSAA